MAIKYVCDICGKEVNQSEVQTSMSDVPLKWASISVSFPSLPKKPYQSPNPGEPYVYTPPPGYEPSRMAIVCSQACAEKALDEAKELLRPAFNSQG